VVEGSPIFTRHDESTVSARERCLSDDLTTAHVSHLVSTIRTIETAAVDQSTARMICRRVPQKCRRTNDIERYGLIPVWPLLWP
jgi:hypothetical protein